MKKIIFVLPSIGISGGVAIVLQHVNRLLARGYDAAVLSLSEGDDVRWFPDNKATIYRKSDFHTLEKNGIDIAVATHFSTVPFVLQMRSLRKIYFVQSDERRFSLEHIDRFMMCEESYRADMEFMTEAMWIQRWLKEEFDKEAYYVPNGLDRGMMYRTDSIEARGQKVRILLEGSINFPFKGMGDAYSAVRDIDADIWIVSANGKPKKDWKYNRFFESIPFFKMNTIYSSCDIFLKMSRVEGFFGPPMEAMACGCAVVVAKVTGYDEYIRDGYNALVVDAGDVEGARAAVTRLINDEALRKRLIENGYKTADEWEWDRSIDLLERVMQGERPEIFYTETFPERYDFAREIKNILIALAQKEKELRTLPALEKKKFFINERLKKWKLKIDFFLFSPRRCAKKYMMLLVKKFL